MNSGKKSPLFNNRDNRFPKLLLAMATGSLLMLVVAAILTLAGCGGVGSSEPVSCDSFANPAGDDDGDGRTNCEEVEGYDIVIDTQGFGLQSGNADTWHVTSNPAVADTDEDGLDDGEEFRQRIDPRDADTDDDGLGDAEEVNRWRTSPRTVDSDDDATDGTGRNATTALWDGAELKLVDDPRNPGRKIPGRWATDPTDSDTDGDGKSDLDELDDTQFNAVVADLPSLAVELTEDPQIELFVEYSQGVLQQDTFGATISRETSSQLSRSDSTSTTLSAELSVTVGAEVTASVPPSASLSASVTGSAGIDKTTGTELTAATTNALAEASSRERSQASKHTVSYSEGRLTLGGVRFRNDGDITYRVDDLDIVVKMFENGKAITLATMDLDDEPFVLQPGEEKAPFFAVPKLTADRTRRFLRNPSALFFETSNAELSDRDDLSFDFIDETASRTALLIVDKGDGNPIKRRVATNVNRTDTGERAGVTLGQALDNLGLSFRFEHNSAMREVVAEVDGTEYALWAGAAPALNDPEGDPGSRTVRGFWAVLGEDARDQDASHIVLQNQDEIRLVYWRDEDRDGVFDREEFVHGASDATTHTDNDGLSDFFEMKVGWDVDVIGANAERVFPSPAASDADADTLSDDEEYARGTNPRSADTDGDGILDRHDPYQALCPLQPPCSTSEPPLQRPGYGDGTSGYGDFSASGILSCRVAGQEVECCTTPDSNGKEAKQYRVVVTEEQTLHFVMSDSRLAPAKFDMLLQSCAGGPNLLYQCTSAGRTCGNFVNDSVDCKAHLSPGEYVLTATKWADTPNSAELFQICVEE